MFGTMGWVRYWFLAAGLCAAAASPLAACGGGHSGSAGAPSSANTLDGSVFDLDAFPPDFDGAGETEGGDARVDAGPQALVRIANFVPDAPAAGFDLCLAPTGTTNWMGPLLARSFAPGSLGQGGPNGIQFSSVSRYFAIPPGLYDAQIVNTGSNCSQGLIPPTYGLPELDDGSFATFAFFGDVTPAGNDPMMSVALFLDDATAPSGTFSLRVINAVPSIGNLDVGMGSFTGGDFSALLPFVSFGRASTGLVDGGSADDNWYVSLNPVRDVEFSMHDSGGTADRATASHLTIPAGPVITMALINGKTGGKRPQFMVCTDNAPPAGAKSACGVVPQ
jgi:hypothetical protein